MKKSSGPIRIFCIRKRWWSAALCLCAAILMFGVVNWPHIVGASAATRQLPIYCVQRDQKLISISFDAAWGNVRLRPGVFRVLPTPDFETDLSGTAQVRFFRCALSRRPEISPLCAESSHFSEFSAFFHPSSGCFF